LIEVRIPEEVLGVSTFDDHGHEGGVCLLGAVRHCVPKALKRRIERDYASSESARNERVRSIYEPFDRAWSPWTEAPLAERRADLREALAKLREHYGIDAKII
jgi:hypothetical protein